MNPRETLLLSPPNNKFYHLAELFFQLHPDVPFSGETDHIFYYFTSEPNTPDEGFTQNQLQYALRRNPPGVIEIIRSSEQAYLGPNMVQTIDPQAVGGLRAAAQIIWQQIQLNDNLSPEQRTADRWNSADQRELLSQREDVIILDPALLRDGKVVFRQLDYVAHQQQELLIDLDDLTSLPRDIRDVIEEVEFNLLSQLTQQMKSFAPDHPLRLTVDNLRESFPEWTIIR